MDQRNLTEKDVLTVSPSVGQIGSTDGENRLALDRGAVKDAAARPVRPAELGTMVRQLKRHSNSNKIFGLSILFGYPVVVIMPLINFLSGYLKTGFHLSVVIAMLFLMWVWFVIIKYFLLTYPHSKSCVRIHKTVTRLASMGELASIGPLCHAMYINNPNPRIAMTALTKLLPQLHDADSIRLGSRELRGLCKILSEKDTDADDASKYSEGFPVDWVAARLAVLDALPYIGDAKCLQIVEQLSIDESADVRMEPVIAAARNCLPKLQERIEYLNSGDTLLRASMRTNVEADVLLKPAVDELSRNEAELLRTNGSD